MTSPTIPATLSDERLKEIRDRARAVRTKAIGAGNWEAVKLMATYAVEVAPVHVVEALVSELLAAREALSAAEYLVDRLHAVQRGAVVRDLEEAEVHYSSASRALSGKRSGKC